MLFDLSEEIEVWLQECGDQKLSKIEALYYRIDYKHGKRLRAFVVLLEKLKGLGAEKFYFKMGSTRSTIIKACLAPKRVMGGKNYATKVVCVAKDLDSAILQVYGSASDYYK